MLTEFYPQISQKDLQVAQWQDPAFELERSAWPSHTEGHE